MAQLWKLPIVFVIENNQYGMGTSVQRASATTELYKRGASFGIPGEKANGMDVLEMRAAGEKAIEYARSGKGPFILEAATYRYRGHSMSDPAKYRSKEEVAKVRQESDPIDNMRHLLLEQKISDEDTLKSLDKDVKSIVTKAADFAQENPEPDPQELYTDILLEA
jgi:pyruvate dehydrogenase E1 component alpha subunit